MVDAVPTAAPSRNLVLATAVTRSILDALLQAAISIDGNLWGSLFFKISKGGPTDMNMLEPVAARHQRLDHQTQFAFHLENLWALSAVRHF